MIVAELQIEPAYSKPDAPRNWRVVLQPRGEAPSREIVAALTDEDLSGLEDVPPRVATWRDFLRALSPNASWRPTGPVLRSAGKLIHQRLLGTGSVKTALAQIEIRARMEPDESLLLQLVVTDDDDDILRHLPIELAFDYPHFVLKRRSRPSLRCGDFSSKMRRLTLPEQPRLLIVTAHSDQSSDPTRDALEAHAVAVADSVQPLGWRSKHLRDATSQELRSILLDEASCDSFAALYVTCHGLESEDDGGLLSLRDGSLPGVELANILVHASELGGPIQLAILCACSSAVPAASGAGTLSMARYLNRTGVPACVGFRGDVDIDWALTFGERLFTELGKELSIERAVASARFRAEVNDPQWALPVIFADRLEPAQTEARSFPERPSGCDEPELQRAMSKSIGLHGESTFSQPVPDWLQSATSTRRRPRPYFTARRTELQRLHELYAGRDTAALSSVVGEGGVGKTELAARFADELVRRGVPVLWLTRPDANVRRTLITLLTAADPSFQASPEDLVEDLAARVKAQYSPHDGLMVLDDVRDGSSVHLLAPGAGWHILVTTRNQELLPGATPVVIRRLESEAALLLLSRVAWGQEKIPQAESGSCARLVKRINGLPLAIELAGSRLRAGQPADEYLESLRLGEGHAADDRVAVQATLARSLSELDKEHLRVFMALGVLPRSGAPIRAIATTVDRPAVRTTHRLDRLVREHMSGYSAELGRFVLHDLLHAAALELARQDERVLDELLAGTGQAIEDLARWVDEPNDRNVDVAFHRWREVAPVFDGLELIQWKGFKPGAKQAARAVASVDHLRQFTDTLEDRGVWLDGAVGLVKDTGGDAEGLALGARGNLRVRKADLEGADIDFAAALGIFRSIQDHLGLANVLQARGALRVRKADLEGAGRDYAEAGAMFRKGQHHLGLANVLKARGDLYVRSDDLPGAAKDYAEALTIFRSIQSGAGQADVLKARGDLCARKDDLAGARKDYDSALVFYQTVQFRIGQANVYRARGDLHVKKDDFTDAISEYDQALALYREEQDRLGQANVLYSRGRLEIRRGYPGAALEWFEQAVSLYVEEKDSLGLSNALTMVADTHGLLGNFEAAKSTLREAIPLARQSHNWYAQKLCEKMSKRLGLPLPKWDD